MLHQLHETSSMNDDLEKTNPVIPTPDLIVVRLLIQLMIDIVKVAEKQTAFGVLPLKKCETVKVSN